MNPIRSLRTWNAARRHRAELRSLAGGGWAPPAPVLSGTYITPETALSLAAVYAAVNVISRDLATLPRAVLRRLDGGGREVAADRPQHELICHSPDDERTAYRFIQTIMGHVLTRGNGYAEIERFRGGRLDGVPRAIHLLHPTKTRPKRTAAGALYYELDGDDTRRLLPEDVLHFAGMGFDGIQGYSPITVCRQTLGIAVAVEQFGASFFGNGAVLRGLLKYPKRLTEAAIKNLRNSFNAIHQGSQGAHQLGILEEGTEYQPTQVSPEDGQFILTRQFQVVDIARIYSIPPHKVGDYSQAHLANVEESNLDYVATTLVGWVTMIEAELNAKLLTREERTTYEIGLDLSALMRGNTTARIAYYQGMRNMGCLNADRINAMEGINPVGAQNGGDKYIVQGQYIPLDQVGKQPITKPTKGKTDANQNQPGA